MALVHDVRRSTQMMCLTVDWIEDFLSELENRSVYCALSAEGVMIYGYGEKRNRIGHFRETGF
jgi:hypothetical protein